MPKIVSEHLSPLITSDIGGQTLAVETQHLTVAINGKEILHDISLRAPMYQVTAIIGPSGSGKSTLIRCFNRMNIFSGRVKLDGTIKLHGKKINSFGDLYLRSMTGMVFQKLSPFAMSIYENVAYGIKSRGIKDRGQLNLLVTEALKDALLWEKYGHNLNFFALSLSGGEQQRLCIARAIAVHPQVLLLDEPTSSLDPASRWKIENTIVKLKQKMSIILVTHDLRQTRRIADIVYFIDQGRIVESGTPETILKHPQNALTKKFIRRYR